MKKFVSNISIKDYEKDGWVVAECPDKNVDKQMFGMTYMVKEEPKPEPKTKPAKPLVEKQAASKK